MKKNTKFPPKKNNTGSTLLLLTLAAYITTLGSLYAQATKSNKLTITVRDVSSTPSMFTSSFYVSKNGYEMRSGNVFIAKANKTFDYYSSDNGAHWEIKPMKPDFKEKLPFGFRRDPVVSLVDKNTGKLITFVNSLDTKGLDPNIVEPPIGEEAYYLRYWVSSDGGQTWDYDEPIIQKGEFTRMNPFPGVVIGTNSIYIGDVGSLPIVTKTGKILLPVQNAPQDENGKIWNPLKTGTYTDAGVLIGTWEKNGKLSWTISKRVKGDPAKSSRGMIEPTVVERADGQLMMVMRGSNDKIPDQPGYKWVSISKDEGYTWSAPVPFTYDDGTNFYSPSAMSTLFKHSSGRCFWIGNISKENSQGNSPRHPVVIAEVDMNKFKLKKNTQLTLDSQTEADKGRGRLDISHFTVLEDRKTKEIIIAYPRSYNAYQEQEWVTLRVALK